MSTSEFEKLGVFYLGKTYDIGHNVLSDQLCLYDSRDLLTHAVCIGMTGSGKTGLCLTVIEEAAIDRIPVIAIDVKGDLTNLLLTFPNLAQSDFEPWVDAEEASRNGLSVSEFAAAQAKQWREGLGQWGQDGQRIQLLKDTCHFTVYTPGSRHGQAVSILKSLSAPAPPMDNLDDPDLLADRLSATVTSLLSLMKLELDPLSREHIFLSTILMNEWKQGRDVTFPVLIQAIQKPSFTQVGALDLETFFPTKERMALSVQLNNVIAAPGFEVWLEGTPLSIDDAFYTKEGKPKVSIFSVAHLGDAERMFFVSLLLTQLTSWMRSQSGTQSLRALFYMDEIAGYLPPVANPPSKPPLLLLMKQARAFGLGLLLATQNPVDLDYKALANAGTWFIGRLQTERDKMRLLDGLEGAASSSGVEFNRNKVGEIISALPKRTFLMNNIHDEGPTIFQTRWTLSYLKGPLSRDQIKKLVAARPKQEETRAPSQPAPVAQAVPAAAGQQLILPPEIKQCYLPVRKAGGSAKLVYQPQLIGIGNVRFLDEKRQIDNTLQYSVLCGADAMHLDTLDWGKSRSAKVWKEDLLAAAEAGSQLAEVPSWMRQAKSYALWQKDFSQWLSENKTVTLFESPLTGLTSKSRESERDFRIRLAQILREQRDKAVEELRDKYAGKLAALENKLATARQILGREEAEAREQQINSAVNVGATILGALVGRRSTRGTISGAASSARSVSRAAKQQGDLQAAIEKEERIGQQLLDLNAECAAEINALSTQFEPANQELKQLVLKAKKTNVNVEFFALAWCPYWLSENGQQTEAWIKQ